MKLSEINAAHRLKDINTLERLEAQKKALLVLKDAYRNKKNVNECPLCAIPDEPGSNLYTNCNVCVWKGYFECEQWFTKYLSKGAGKFRRLAINRSPKNVEKRLKKLNVQLSIVNKAIELSKAYPLTEVTP